MSGSRSTKRAVFSTADRVILLEDDADKLEKAMDGIQAQLRRLTQVLLGALVMLSTSAILLAINLAI